MIAALAAAWAAVKPAQPRIMQTDAADSSAGPAPSLGNSGRQLHSSKSFNKLKFGKEKHKAPSTASTSSTSTSSSLQTSSSFGSEDDGGEEISWHIQSASSTPTTIVGGEMLRDLVIISTIGACLSSHAWLNMARRSCHTCPVHLRRTAVRFVICTHGQLAVHASHESVNSL